MPNDGYMEQLLGIWSHACDCTRYRKLLVCLQVSSPCREETFPILIFFPLQFIEQKSPYRHKLCHTKHEYVRKNVEVKKQHVFLLLTKKQEEKYSVGFQSQRADIPLYLAENQRRYSQKEIKQNLHTVPYIDMNN